MIDTSAVKLLSLVLLLAPALGCLIAGFFGKKIGRAAVSWVTIILVGVSLALAIYFMALMTAIHPEVKAYNFNVYNWVDVTSIHFRIGFLIDRLTCYMMIVVTFVSFFVHIYSIGYMDDDPGYTRFFCYISGFTFAMLSLVLANNFLLLYFGWEGVGLVSYLLIGFWFHREKSNVASIKAFIVNRVGDLGFLLGIALVLMYTNSLDYQTVFGFIPGFAKHSATVALYPSGPRVDVITLMCILLFVGAMGKSAQIPLHVWLEGSMEGPTPISALIHAATMVTAGVYMVSRLSPMFEFSVPAMSMILVLGSATCFFMGLIGLVQMDIKRVIAYSTLSQLGYMMAGEGASAFSLGLYHLMTHASFKALLFLAAGSVILGMHHEQDMRKMGGLRKYMPVTYICFLVGALSLAAIPPFSGFYSKDLIIEAVQHCDFPGADIATFFVVGGAMVTALYTFRMFFMVFHGETRMSDEAKSHMKESPVSVLIPLIALAIPAFAAGFMFFGPLTHHFFQNDLFLFPRNDIITVFAKDYPSAWAFLVHSFTTLPFWLAISGIFIMWLSYVAYPKIPGILASRFKSAYFAVGKKFFVDDVYDYFLTKPFHALSKIFWFVGDHLIIDGVLVNGSVRAMRFIGRAVGSLQTGYIYQYAFVMLIGLIVILIAVIF